MLQIDFISLDYIIYVFGSSLKFTQIPSLRKQEICHSIHFTTEKAEGRNQDVQSIAMTFGGDGSHVNRDVFQENVR